MGGIKICRCSTLDKTPGFCVCSSLVCGIYLGAAVKSPPPAPELRNRYDLSQLSGTLRVLTFIPRLWTFK